ncbi:hypothetical protein BJX96DRAFT_59862 [Aspergillus floccosus]
MQGPLLFASGNWRVRRFYRLHLRRRIMGLVTRERTVPSLCDLSLPVWFLDPSSSSVHSSEPLRRKSFACTGLGFCFCCLTLILSDFTWFPSARGAMALRSERVDCAG